MEENEILNFHTRKVLWCLCGDWCECSESSDCHKVASYKTACLLRTCGNRFRGWFEKAVSCTWNSLLCLSLRYTFWLINSFSIWWLGNIWCDLLNKLMQIRENFSLNFYVSIYLSVCLSNYLSIYLSICHLLVIYRPSIYPSMYHLFIICICVCLYTNVCVCMYVLMYECMDVQMFISASVCVHVTACVQMSRQLSGVDSFLPPCMYVYLVGCIELWLTGLASALSWWAILLA